jgi:integrase
VAYLDTKIGQIRDRTKGYPEISYYIPKSDKKYMRECLSAHELLIHIFPREKVTGAELRGRVILYAALNREGRQEYLRQLVAAPTEAPAVRGVPIKELLDAWVDRKVSEGVSEKQRANLVFYHRIISRFFAEKGIEHTEGLKDDTAHEYLKWRRETNLHTHKANPISASTLRHEIQVLLQIARLGAKKKWIDSGLWDDVRVKSTPGVDKKVVLSLSIAEQKELLGRLRTDDAHHDMVLLLLVTGMRIGELATLSANSISNNVLTLHEEGIGANKPTTGKTPSAVRKLPVCLTIIEIFKRGFIFKKSVESLRIKLKRLKDLKVHAHRLRHSFAVNKLHTKTDLKTVSYQMGHRDIGMTSNQYGVFVPADFKHGFEGIIDEAKRWLDFIENNYF